MSVLKFVRFANTIPLMLVGACASIYALVYEPPREDRLKVISGVVEAIWTSHNFYEIDVTAKSGSHTISVASNFLDWSEIRAVTSGRPIWAKFERETDYNARTERQRRDRWGLPERASNPSKVYVGVMVLNIDGRELLSYTAARQKKIQEMRSILFLVSGAFLGWGLLWLLIEWNRTAST